MLSKAIEYLESPAKTETIISSTANIIDSANSLLLSLQKPDIDAEQIASVDQQLKSLQHQLSNMIDKFSNNEIFSLSQTITYHEKESETHIHRALASDPDAPEGEDHVGNEEEIDTMFENSYRLKEEIKTSDIGANENYTHDYKEVDSDIDKQNANEKDFDINSLDNDLKTENEVEDEIENDWLGEDNPSEEEEVIENSDKNEESTDNTQKKDTEDQNEYSQDDIDALFGR
jgi:hypothetical protein